MSHHRPMPLVMCCVLMFACGVGAMGAFNIFFSTSGTCWQQQES